MFKISDLTIIRDELSRLPLVVEGASGSLGLSILKVLRDLSIRPKSLVLTTNSTAISKDWQNVSDDILHLRRLNDDFSDRLSDALRRNEFNLIFAAGYGQPAKFMENPKGAIESNSDHLLFYKDYEINYLAYMSTSEIYSGINGEAFEDSQPVSTPKDTRSVYIEAKRLGEAITHNILSHSAKRHAVYRIALAFPPQLIPGDNRVLADLVAGGKNNGRVVLNGGAEYFRQYQYGPNAILKVLGSLVFGHSNLYNNSGSIYLTLGQLAKEVAEILRVPVEITSGNEAGAPAIVNINSQRIKIESRYEASHELSLGEYLREIIYEN